MERKVHNMLKKKIATLIIAAALAAVSLAGCGAMPSIGGSETGSTEEKAGADASEETDADGKVTLRIVDWSDGSANQREEFHKNGGAPGRQH